MNVSGGYVIAITNFNIYHFSIQYKYLDLNIKATGEGADIKGYLDAGVLTIAQTSA